MAERLNIKRQHLSIKRQLSAGTKKVKVVHTRPPSSGLSRRFQQHCKTSLKVLRGITLSNRLQECPASVPPAAKECLTGHTATDSAHGGKEAASSQKYHKLLHTSNHYLPKSAF